MRGHCNVVRLDCKVPANGPVGHVLECFACGLPVCTACSKRRRWYGHGTRRVCLDCIEGHSKQGG